MKLYALLEIYENIIDISPNLDNIKKRKGDLNNRKIIELNEGNIIKTSAGIELSYMQALNAYIHSNLETLFVLLNPEGKLIYIFESEEEISEKIKELIPEKAIVTFKDIPIKNAYTLLKLKYNYKVKRNIEIIIYNKIENTYVVIIDSNDKIIDVTLTYEEAFDLLFNIVVNSIEENLQVDCIKEIDKEMQSVFNNFILQIVEPGINIKLNNKFISYEEIHDFFIRKIN